MATSEAHKRAVKKWQTENNESFSVKLRIGKDPSREQIKAAAAREGLSLNAFVIAAIKDKL